MKAFPCGLALVLLLLGHASAGRTEAVDYGSISPILSARCVKCHAEVGVMGSAPEGYLLSSYEAALSSWDRVRVVPGFPAASELVRRVQELSRPRMPYDGPPFLQEGEILRIIDWIEAGALNGEGQPARYPLGARIRLQGRLIDFGQLDGEVTLHVSAATKIDTPLDKGDYMEVRGHLSEDGAITVDRLRRR